jgi:hypothetical protein
MDHGKWLPWLTANKDTLGFDTDRTARLLIAAAADRKSTSDLDRDEAAIRADERDAHRYRGIGSHLRLRARSIDIKQVGKMSSSLSAVVSIFVLSM